MAKQPHDKTGKKCSVCLTPFEKNMLTLTSVKKEESYITYETVCYKCKLNEYSFPEKALSISTRTYKTIS